MVAGVLIWDAVIPMHIAMVPRLSHTKMSLSDVRSTGSSTNTRHAAVITSNSGRMNSKSAAEKVIVVGSPVRPGLLDQWLIPLLGRCVPQSTHAQDSAGGLAQ